MAFSQKQLDALEASIAAGVTSVSYEGKTSTFRSMTDMWDLRARMRRELGLTGQNATILTAFDRPKCMQ